MLLLLGLRVRVAAEGGAVVLAVVWVSRVGVTNEFASVATMMEPGMLCAAHLISNLFASEATVCAICLCVCVAAAVRIGGGYATMMQRRPRQDVVSVSVVLVRKMTERTRPSACVVCSTFCLAHSSVVISATPVWRCENVGCVVA